MKIDHRYLELMHGEIDGVNPARDSEDLRDYLARSPEAREHFERLRELSATLDRVGQVDPPSDLRPNVLRAVRSVRRPDPVGSEGGRWWSFGGAAVLRYAAAMAAGVVLGVLGLQLVEGRLPGGPLDRDDLAGTMTRIERAPAPTGATVLEFADGSGNATVAAGENGDAVRFEIEAAGPIEVVMAYDPADLAFRGVTRDSGEVRELHVAPDRVTWILEGFQRVTVQVQRRSSGPADVELRFLGTEGPVGMSRLELPAIDSRKNGVGSPTSRKPAGS